MIKLAVFLGNPGKEYSRNRHNAGFLLADKLPFSASLSWQKKFSALYAVMEGTNSHVHLIKPQTFMNMSGKSVAQAASFFKIEHDAILVVHDELELPFGTLSLKFSGGLGGHNGLRSLKACLGSADFWRIRIGIGRPDSRQPGEGGPPGSGVGIVDWVLSNFDINEMEALGTVLETGAKLLLETFENDPENLLGEWVKKKVPLQITGS